MEVALAIIKMISRVVAMCIMVYMKLNGETEEAIYFGILWLALLQS